MQDCDKKSKPDRIDNPNVCVCGGVEKGIPVLAKPVPPKPPVAPQRVVHVVPVKQKQQLATKPAANVGEQKAQDKMPPPADSQKSSGKWMTPVAVCFGMCMLGLGGWLAYDLMLSSHHTLPTQNEPSTSVMTPAPAEKSHDSAVAGASSELAVESVMPSAPIPEPTPEERYNNGANAPSEPIAAIAWYRKFSEQGIIDATYRLGLSYYNARTMPLNFVKAVEALRKAAEQGHQEAASKLAECYEWGVGVDASAEEAAKWRPSGMAAPTPIGEPAEPVEKDDVMASAGSDQSSLSLADQPKETWASSTDNSMMEDRSSLDPLIARMRALRCRYATSALYQKRLLTLLPMIRNGANVDITLPETKGNTALHYACAIGSLGITQWLLEHGANPNAVTDKGATPLMCVGNDNRAAITQALLNHGARQAQPSYQSTPSYGGGNRASLDPLIARMRALRCRHATSALYQKRLLTLLPMIRNGAHVDITLPETKGNTALHYACAIGSLSITRWLLENGANPNAVTNKGATPLMCVGSDNRAAIIQALRAYGAVR